MDLKIRLKTQKKQDVLSNSLTKDTPLQYDSQRRARYCLPANFNCWLGQHTFYREHLAD